MGRRCVLTAGKAERAELDRLSRSAARGEADRARAVLWSLDGETSVTIAARLGVRGEQVRRWRSGGRSGGPGRGGGGEGARRGRGAAPGGGPAALPPPPGRARTPRKREAALAVAR